ncbi:hypothetical protein Ahia01_000984700 [Argonauta hians]
MQSSRSDFINLVSKVHYLLYHDKLEEFMRILNIAPIADRRYICSVRFNGLTPLFFAAATNQVSVINYLVAVCDTLVDQRCCLYNSIRVTPLWVAVVKGNYNAAYALIKLGANINARGWWESTPLLKALLDKNYELSLLLLSCGARPDACNVQRMTPLMAATFNEDLTNVILESGNSGKYQLDIYGNSALHYAVKNSKMHVAEFLAHSGIDPKVPNNKGVDCFSQIRERQNRLRGMPATYRRLEFSSCSERQPFKYREANHYYYDPLEHDLDELDIYKHWDIETSHPVPLGFGSELAESYYRI